MNIHYKIEFFSDWHCGSGLAAGADVDALVVKDKNGLPFIPGKTIKGLVREAVEDINEFAEVKIDEAEIKKAFGFFNEEKDEKGDMQQGHLFFTNAELPEKQREAIIANDAAEFLCRAVSSTAIGEDGIAKEHSLRKMQIVVPCTLEGEIIEIGEIKDVSDGMIEIIKKSLHYIKRLGQNRNRGLGRCQITIIDEKGGDK